MQIFKSELLVPKFSFFPFVIAITLIIGSFYNQNITMTSAIVKQINEELNLSGLENKMYLEFCLSRVVERQNCIFSQPFFLLKKENFVYEKSRTRSLKDLIKKLGNGFSTTKHFASFYKKLIELDKDLNDLPSMALYTSLVHKKKVQLDLAFRDNMVLTGNHQGVGRYIGSIFYLDNIFLSILGFFILYITGLYLTLFYGKILYPLVFLTSSFLVLVYYVQTIDNDSLSIIMGGGILVIMSLGMVLTGLKKYSFFLLNLKVNYVYLWGLLFIIFEFLAHRSSQLFIPARAHFMALIFGGLTSMIFKRLTFYPSTFFSKKEYKEWEILQKEEDQFIYLNKLQELIKKNLKNTTLVNGFLDKIVLAIYSGVNQKAFVMHLYFIIPKLKSDQSQSFEKLLNLYKIDNFMLEQLMLLDNKLMKVLSKSKNLGGHNLIRLKMIQVFNSCGNDISNIITELYQLPIEELKSYDTVLNFLANNEKQSKNKNVFINLLRKRNALS